MKPCRNTDFTWGICFGGKSGTGSCGGGVRVRPFEYLNDPSRYPRDGIRFAFFGEFLFREFLLFLLGLGDLGFDFLEFCLALG